MSSKPACCEAVEARGDIALMLKALGHPVRLEMVHQLKQDGLRCCGELCNCFSHSQSTISQHLSVLADAGIIRREQSGNRSVFSLNLDAIADIERHMAILGERAKTGMPSD